MKLRELSWKTIFCCSLFLFVGISTWIFANFQSIRGIDTETFSFPRQAVVAIKASKAVTANGGQPISAEQVQVDFAVEDPKAMNFVSVPWMLPGYCVAGSRFRDLEARGGFGQSKNFPLAAYKTTDAKLLYLVAQPGVVTQFGKQPGMRVLLINQTGQMLSFFASDSRLAIIQEAQDDNGVWRAIEYLPRSWCGNSYHRVSLPSAHFWIFPAPRYQGEFPTRLRFTMALEDGSFVHSNVFEGSIQREQFVLRQDYSTGFIMDPYGK